MMDFRGTMRSLWPFRRWLYAAYMAIAIARIPARTGFHLVAPACDTRLTAQTVALSLTKVPHIVLFACFFLFTAAQFDRADRRTVAWSLLATVGLGILVEIEEGATRTGNCRLTDLAPDALGGVIAMAVLLAAVLVGRRVRDSAR